MLLFTSLLTAPLALHADDFTFSGVLKNNAPLTGTFSLDNSGNVTAVSLSDGTATYDGLLGNVGFNGLTVEQIYSSSNNNVLTLILPGGFSGGDVCSDNNLCQGYATYLNVAVPNTYALQVDLVSGSATLVPGTGGGTTPEPSGIALVTTGLAGVCGAVRRRMRRG